jgi:hypothetical protein
VFKCWILFEPVLGVVDSNLHFPEPSMNRLNHTESATFSIFSILPCWAFFRGSVFLYFKEWNADFFSICCKNALNLTRLLFIMIKRNLSTSSSFLCPNIDHHQFLICLTRSMHSNLQHWNNKKVCIILSSRFPSFISGYFIAAPICSSVYLLWFTHLYMNLSVEV